MMKELEAAKEESRLLRQEMERMFTEVKQNEDSLPWISMEYMDVIEESPLATMTFKYVADGSTTILKGVDCESFKAIRQG